MDFLKDAALPQSTEHFQLLLLMLNLVYVIFLPYIGFLLGSAILSLRAVRPIASPEWRHRHRFAKDVMEIALYSGGVVTFFGVVPAFTMVFVYAQLLQGTPAISTGLMGWGALLQLAGVVLLFAYRQAFRFAPVAETYDQLRKTDPASAELLRESAAYARDRVANQARLGRWGVALITTATILTVGAMTVASDQESWSGIGSVFDLFLSPAFLLKYLQFACVAAGSTGLGMLFFFFIWQGGGPQGDPAYHLMVRKTGLTLAIASVLLQPVMIVLNVIALPAPSLSGGLFGLAGASLLLFFLSALFLYAYGRHAEGGYISYAFYALGVALLLLFTADQVAVSNATRPHAARLAVAYDRTTEDLKSRLGIAMKSMSGAEIYDAKCSACHLGDQKKVGPPYKVVIPKYGGDKAKLVAFVLNPVKVDPAYPPMPNQGLKPAEADSIAAFLLSKYGGPAVPHAMTPSDSMR
jgi:cytochrome c